MQILQVVWLSCSINKVKVFQHNVKGNNMRHKMRTGDITFKFKSTENYGGQLTEKNSLKRLLW